MMKRIIALALMLVLCLPLAACRTAGLQKYEAEFIGIFDTLTQIAGYAESKAAFETEVSAIKADLQAFHELYDIYHSYPGITNLKDINDRAGQGPVKVDARIINLLEYSQEAFTLSSGRVNIALGSVLKIWHDYREVGMDDPEHAAVPGKDELAAASRHTDIGNLVVDREHLTVELKDPEMRLDVGAIAKGFATEQAVQAAIARGSGHLLLSVGGNIRAIGYRNDKNESWRAGIENPDETNDDFLAILNIHDLSVVTSGVYERYYEVDGKRYHHIIDPDTLFPENRFLSVTVVTQDSGLADMLSTALFNMSYDDGLKLINRLGDVEALWCFPDGSLKESPGMAAYR